MLNRYMSYTSDHLKVEIVRKIMKDGFRRWRGGYKINGKVYLTKVISNHQSSSHIPRLHVHAHVLPVPSRCGFRQDLWAEEREARL